MIPRMIRVFVVGLLGTTADAFTIRHQPQEASDAEATALAASQHEQGWKLFVDRYPFTRFAVTEPGFCAMFDWKVSKVGDLQDSSKVDLSKDPTNLFISSNLIALRKLLKIFDERFDNGRTDRRVYVTGDLMTSKLDSRVGPGTTAKLQKYFAGGIWFQSLDVERPGFKAAPDGLNAMYMKPIWHIAQQAIETASIHHKPRGGLAAWGRLHPDLNFYPARRKLVQWVNSSAPSLAGVEHNSWPMDQYWGELAKYKFLLSPRGGGIQSPKNDEALLVLTIPITTRDGEKDGLIEPCFDDLVKIGYPIVVLDDWNEITKDKLDLWWTQLSPRLVSFRRNCITSEGFWKIFTGQVTYCE